MVTHSTISSGNLSSSLLSILNHQLLHFYLYWIPPLREVGTESNSESFLCVRSCDLKIFVLHAILLDGRKLLLDELPT